MDFIPVHRPQLPLSYLIEPYLKRIDETRWYSNFGPLVNEFEIRIAKHFGIEPTMITTAVNGTLILTSLLKALNLPENSLCIMPSWTFVATASAAYYAGLVPYFVDVESSTQMLHPLHLKEKLSSITGVIGVVIVIAPFGAPIEIDAWDKFSDETGIPVIIDAAAGFDSVGVNSKMPVSKTPMMISLHATKIFGIGEGGLALSTDAHLIRKVKLMTCFGFNGEREALMLGFNAKLSEYMAAVGLASLDNWQRTRKAWQDIRDQYMLQFKKINVEAYLSQDWVSSTCNVIIPGKADLIANKLKKAGVDTRKWWLNGCHQHQAYQHFPRENCLKHTEWLSQSVLGLPFAIDLKAEQIEYICQELMLASKAN